MCPRIDYCPECGACLCDKCKPNHNIYKCIADETSRAYGRMVAPFTCANDLSKQAEYEISICEQEARIASDNLGEAIDKGRAINPTSAHN